MGCGWTLFRNEAGIKEKYTKVDELIDLWNSKTRLKQLSGNDTKYFKDTYREITGLDFDYDVRYPSDAKLKRLENKIH